MTLTPGMEAAVVHNDELAAHLMFAEPRYLLEDKGGALLICGLAPTRGQAVQDGRVQSLCRYFMDAGLDTKMIKVEKCPCIMIRGAIDPALLERVKEVIPGSGKGEIVDAVRDDGQRIAAAAKVIASSGKRER